MTLKRDKKFKGKLTCGLKNNVRNLVDFHVSSRKFENLHFDRILLSKAYKDLDEKNTEELCFMTLKSDAKLEEKLTLGSKNDMRNLVNFHPTTQKSKNFTSMGYFCPKYMRFELKKYRGVIFHDTEQWCKIRINPDLVVSKMARGIGWTFIRALKSEELHSDQGRIQRFWKGGRGYSMSVAMVSRQRKF